MLGQMFWEIEVVVLGEGAKIGMGIHIEDFVVTTNHDR